jgi:hypothetical protein
VVKIVYLADFRVFVVVLLWTKRGELRGKRGGKTVTFCGAKRGTGFLDLFSRDRMIGWKG